MNPEDFINAMNGNNPNGFRQPPSVTKEQIDEFIERCCKERGYDEHSLFEAIQTKLMSRWHSASEEVVYPIILRYMSTGEV